MKLKKDAYSDKSMLFLGDSHLETSNELIQNNYNVFSTKTNKQKALICPKYYLKLFKMVRISVLGDALKTILNAERAGKRHLKSELLMDIFPRKGR